MDSSYATLEQTRRSEAASDQRFMDDHANPVHHLCQAFGIPESSDRLLLTLSFLRDLFTHKLSTEDHITETIDRISENIRNSRIQHEELRELAHELLEKLKPHARSIRQQVTLQASQNTSLGRPVTHFTEEALIVAGNSSMVATHALRRELPSSCREAAMQERAISTAAPSHVLGLAAMIPAGI